MGQAGLVLVPVGSAGGLLRGRGNLLEDAREAELADNSGGCDPAGLPREGSSPGGL